MHLLISKKKTYYLFLFFFLVSINNFSILNLNFPKIEKIEISGVNITESKKIKKIINDLSFENIFLINKSEIRKKILSLNNIEQLRIFKNYPSTLKIDIKKTKFLALTKNNGLDYFVGSNGKLIQKNDATLNLPFIFGDLNIQEFLKLKNKIDNSNFEFGQITNFYFFKSKRWDIEIENGVLIKLSKQNTELSLNNALLFLNNKKFNKNLIVDARVKNQIVIHE